MPHLPSDVHLTTNIYPWSSVVNTGSNTGARRPMIESAPMQAIDRRKLATLMVLHLLWGFVLWFSISKLGLGISTDSVPMLFAGTDLFASRGFTSFDGSPVLAWPPLYPF